MTHLKKRIKKHGGRVNGGKAINRLAYAATCIGVLRLTLELIEANQLYHAPGPSHSALA